MSTCRLGHTVVVLTNLGGAAWPVNERMRDLMTRLEQGVPRRECRANS